MNARSLLCCALLAAPVAAAAEPHGLPLWQLEGDDNRVYLLGSVHLLRESDYPLPAEIDAAYDDAEALVMELDMDDLDPNDAAALAAELGVIAGDGSLATLLGPEDYAEVSALAATADIPLATLSRTEPWLAALTVEQLLLTRLGFDSGIGLESHLARRAQADGKAITGLETLAEQLGVLDRLPLESQRRLLIHTLEDSVELGATMDEMLRAWRAGDLPALENAMLAEMLDQPELYAALLVGRNRRFTERIVELLDDADDYLVVIGMLHMIGEDGVPHMLAQRGHPAAQLERFAARPPRETLQPTAR